VANHTKTCCTHRLVYLKKSNERSAFSPKHRYVPLTAVRDIVAGEQLFMDYGPGYCLEHGITRTAETREGAAAKETKKRASGAKKRLRASSELEAVVPTCILWTVGRAMAAHRYKFVY
jgi:hypothetical protein